MRKILITTIAFIFLISLMSVTMAQNFVFKEDTALDLKIACFDENNNYCNSSVECNLTILTPSHDVVINNQEMTHNSAFYNYSLNTSQMAGLGEHSVISICTGNSTGFSTFTFIVTSTGQLVEPVNTVIVIVLMGLAFVFLVLSFFFKEEYWILKSLFQFLAVLAGLISVNAARIIASESDALGVMGGAGIMLMIVVLLLFFLWIFVYAFKEIIKIFKEKGNLRWNYD